MDGTMNMHFPPGSKVMCSGSGRPPAEVTPEDEVVEFDLEYFDESPDGRVSVPLRMFKGNIEVLLENKIPCLGVSFVRDPEHRNAIILVFHGTDKEAAEKVGFKTAPIRNVP